MKINVNYKPVIAIQATLHTNMMNLTSNVKRTAIKASISFIL